MPLGLFEDTGVAVHIRQYLTELSSHSLGVNADTQTHEEA